MAKVSQGIDEDLRAIEKDYKPSDTDAQKIKMTVQRWMQYRDKRKDWDTKVTKDLEYFLLKQWTKDQETELSARGQAPLIIDRIRPAINQLIAILTANAPSFRVTGVTDDDVKIAQMFSDIIQHIWYENDGNEMAADWVKSMLIYGVSYLYWYFDEYGDEGKAKIRFESLNPMDIFVDPEARKEDLSDASSIIFSRMITRERALALFPQFADKIKRVLPSVDDEKMYEGSDMHDEELVKILDEVRDEEKDLLRYFEEYTKQRVQFSAFVDTITGETKELSPDKAEIFKQDIEIAKGLEAGEITEITVWKTRIHKRMIIGSILASEDLMPISICPIVPLFYEHQKNPYPMGAIRGLRGLQDEINARRSLMIAHAANTTNSKLLYFKGVFDNETNIDQTWARPSATMGVNPSGNHKLSDLVHTPAPLPLPTALYQLEAEAKHDIEYNIGLFSTSQGDTTNAPNTFRATLAIEEYGSRRHALYSRKIGYALRRSGKVCLAMIQNYMDKTDIIRLVQPAKLTAEQEPGKQINWPLYDEYGKETEKLNDLTVGEYDLMVVDGSMLPSNRWALLETYMQMYQAQAIDKLELWKKTDIVDREGLQQRFSEMAQMQSQIQQLTKQLKETSNQLTRETQKRATAEQRAELEKMKGRVKEAEVGYKDEAKGAISDLKIATKEEKASKKEK
jgi:hypothetical protein